MAPTSKPTAKLVKMADVKKLRNSAEALKSWYTRVEIMQPVQKLVAKKYTWQR